MSYSTPAPPGLPHPRLPKRHAQLLALEDFTDNFHGRSDLRGFLCNHLKMMNRGIYLTPPTPKSSVLGYGRGLSEDAA
jgi:hypothetical protein